ncbi:MAG: hypothetical protein JWM11_5662 [Planctomycetaceae bacterium]|nr:hypothetical protein [Planctomycetaceae bacterium]
MIKSGSETLRLSRPQILRFLAAVVFLSAITTGCQLPNRMKLSKSGSPQYEKANIVYRLDGELRPLPLSDTEIKPLSFDDAVSAAPLASNPGSDWSTATLSVQYPHPDGTPELARATLRLSASPLGGTGLGISQASRWLGKGRSIEPSILGEAAKPPQRDDEIWILDLPKQELDLLVADLRKSGFFQAQTRTESGTKLDVQLDSARVNKEWSPEPRLDQFISRVYVEGRLGGLVACETPDEHNGVIAGR